MPASKTGFASLKKKKKFNTEYCKILDYYDANMDFLLKEFN